MGVVTKCHPCQSLDKLLDKTLDNNITDKNKETGLNDDIKEDDFLSLDELNDFLSMNESDLEVSSKKTSKQDREITDVSVDSDHKNTQCPATDDELPDVDLDDEEDPEKELKREQRKAEIKERFRNAKLKNKVSDLDDFDDSDDDFTFTPKRKLTPSQRKKKLKSDVFMVEECFNENL